MSERIVHDPEILEIGEVPFLYLQDNSGGRFIRADSILSIVPNFRLGGAMIFIKGAEKAITVEQEPQEIRDYLASEN